MLPTQFIPEYYRDAKDILGADEAENKRDNPRKRRWLLSRIRNPFRRSARADKSKEREERVRPAH